MNAGWQIMEVPPPLPGILFSVPAFKKCVETNAADFLMDLSSVAATGIAFCFPLFLNWDAKCLESDIFFDGEMFFAKY
jgi:hypothetical protein